MASSGFGSASIFYLVIIIIGTLIGLVPIFSKDDENVPLNVTAWVFSLVTHILVFYGLYELTRNGCYEWAWGVIGIGVLGCITLGLYAVAHSPKLNKLNDMSKH